MTRIVLENVTPFSTAGTLQFAGLLRVDVTAWMPPSSAAAYISLLAVDNTTVLFLANSMLCDNSNALAKVSLFSDSR